MPLKNHNAMLAFLTPRVANVVVTLVIYSLPFIREQAPMDNGGVFVSYYRPIYLLATYLQMGEGQALLLMLGLLAAIYVAVSFALACVERVRKPRKKTRK